VKERVKERVTFQITLLYKIGPNVLSSNRMQETYDASPHCAKSDYGVGWCSLGSLTLFNNDLWDHLHCSFMHRQFVIERISKALEPHTGCQAVVISEKGSHKVIPTLHPCLIVPL